MTGDVTRDIYAKIGQLGARLDALCERVQEIIDEISAEEILVADGGSDGDGEDVEGDL